MNHPRLTLVLVVAAVTSLSGCAPRLIKLPDNRHVPAAAAFKMGANSRTTLLEYEVPRVKVSKVRSAGFSIGGFGKQKAQMQRAFSVNRPGGSIDVSCEAVQEGARVMALDYTKHTYNCGGSNFELRVEEQQRDVFVGAARLNGVNVDIVSTDDMEQGPPQGPSGFHLRRGGRWLASFEYFQAGNAYLAGDLSAEERDAVLTAMVVIQSSNLWLTRSANDHSTL